jgi:hypothetical protein
MHRGKRSNLVLLYFCLEIFLIVLGCGGGGGNVNAPDTGVSGTVSGELKSGIRITLTDGTTTSVTTTDANGIFRFPAKANGTYTITPSASIYNTFSPLSSTIKVSGGVADKTSFKAIATLPSMNRDKASVTLLVGQTKQLKASSPDSITETNDNVTWESSDALIVAVSSKGLITGIADGDAIVTAIKSDGKTVATYSVSVVQPGRLIVIIKADDLLASVGSSFTRLFEICKLMDVPVAAGLVIGTLETATERERAFLANLDPQECELWIHGYTHYINYKDSTTEFNGPDLSTQIATIQKCVDACQLYLKRDLSVFNGPGGVADKNTALALDKFPSIKTVFYLPVEGNRFVIPRLVWAEWTSGKMNNHKIIIASVQKLPAGSVAVLNTHPKSWDETDWNEFVLLIDALKSNGAIFMTPTEYKNWVER